jgi:hypothetical protein
MSFSLVRVRSTSRGGEEVEPIDHGAESEGSITSTHPSRPYTLSLPDGSSDAGADLNPLRKDSGDSGTSSVFLKDGEGVVAVVAMLVCINSRLRSRVVHRVPMPWANNYPLPRFIGSSALKGSVSENVMKATSYSDAVRFVLFHFSFVI